MENDLNELGRDFINEQEIDYEDFVIKLFSEEPKNPGEVIISLEVNKGNKLDIRGLFEKLLLLFKDGMIYFYKNEEGKIPLENITKPKIEKLNKYFHSFRLNINYKVVRYQDIEEYKKYIVDSNKRKITFLEENADNTNDNIGNIFFEIKKPELIDLLDYRYIMSCDLQDRRLKLKKDDMVYIIWFSFIN